jgi:hypothetical protein
MEILKHFKNFESLYCLSFTQSCVTLGFPIESFSVVFQKESITGKERCYYYYYFAITGV